MLQLLQQLLLYGLQAPPTVQQQQQQWDASHVAQTQPLLASTTVLAGCRALLQLQ
jgi:hypothetical protein